MQIYFLEFMFSEKYQWFYNYFLLNDPRFFRDSSAFA